jgi:hypothetical protein
MEQPLNLDVRIELEDARTICSYDFADEARVHILMLPNNHATAPKKNMNGTATTTNGANNNDYAIGAIGPSNNHNGVNHNDPLGAFIHDPIDAIEPNNNNAMAPIGLNHNNAIGAANNTSSLLLSATRSA